MSSLVQTKTNRVTFIKAVPKGNTQFAIGNTALLGAGAGLSAIYGVGPEFLSLFLLGIPAIAGVWTLGIKRNLRQGISDWNYTSLVNTSVFGFFGRSKTYEVDKLNERGKRVKAKLVIGRGEAYLNETVEFEPIDVWDSSMAAVRNVYSLERASINDWHPDYSDQLSFHDDYVEYGSDFHDYAISDARSQQIEKYEREIDDLRSMSPCPQAALKAKQDRLRQIEANWYSSY